MAATWPVMVRWGKHQLGIGPETKDADEARVSHTFEEIAGRLGDGRRYLSGDRFTAADLTFAALSARSSSHRSMAWRFRSRADRSREVRAFREHPAGAYALRLFRELRRTQAISQGPEEQS